MNYTFKGAFLSLNSLIPVMLFHILSDRNNIEISAQIAQPDGPFSYSKIY